eukprot:COSAG02_NODE_3964_length_5977_cov_24.620619_1_plen_118_part_10
MLLHGWTARSNGAHRSIPPHPGNSACISKHARRGGRGAPLHHGTRSARYAIARCCWPPRAAACRFIDWSIPGVYRTRYYSLREQYLPVVGFSIAMDQQLLSSDSEDEASGRERRLSVN